VVDRTIVDDSPVCFQRQGQESDATRCKEFGELNKAGDKRRLRNPEKMREHEAVDVNKPMAFDSKRD
jgi:hypothetical protein